MDGACQSGGEGAQRAEVMIVVNKCWEDPEEEWESGLFSEGRRKTFRRIP